jgi:hypothetical protein
VRWKFKEQAVRGREIKNVCERDKTYGRLTHRWKDNIKIYLYKIGFYGVNWYHIVHCNGSYGFLRTYW